MGFLICATTGHFADDVQARCSSCDAPIMHRPHVNPDLIKICMACLDALLEADGTKPVIAVTKETLREVALWGAKTKGVQ